jgi:hypothetical protein
LCVCCASFSALKLDGTQFRKSLTTRSASHAVFKLSSDADIGCYRVIDLEARPRSHETTALKLYLQECLPKAPWCTRPPQCQPSYQWATILQRYTTASYRSSESLRYHLIKYPIDLQERKETHLLSWAESSSIPPDPIQWTVQCKSECYFIRTGLIALTSNSWRRNQRYWCGATEGCSETSRREGGLRGKSNWSLRY